MSQIEGWRISWYCFAGFALVVAVAFMFIFKEDPHKKMAATEEEIIDSDNPGGIIIDEEK